jgi:hypothetical protein
LVFKTVLDVGLFMIETPLAHGGYIAFDQHWWQFFGSATLFGL